MLAYDSQASASLTGLAGFLRACAPINRPMIQHSSIRMDSKMCHRLTSIL